MSDASSEAGEGLGLAEAIASVRADLLAARQAGADAAIQLPVASLTVELKVVAARQLRVVVVQLPNGRALLAGGSHDGTLRLWDPATGTAVGEPMIGHTNWVEAVAAVRPESASRALR